MKMFVALMVAPAWSLKVTWRPAAGRGALVQPPRSGAVAVAAGEGRVLLFGGYAEDTSGARKVVNDLWAFDANSDEWTCLQSDRAAGHSVPQPRLVSAAALTSGGDSMLVFGGWDPQLPGTGGDILADVWSLKLATLEWTRCDPMPVGPTSRHVAVTVNSKLIVHTFRSESSVLVFDERRQTLVEQPTSGPAPSARGLHAAAAVGDQLVVFGGAAQAGEMFNDLFSLDTISWRWERLRADGPGPTARAGACAAAVGSTFILACGAERADDGLLPRSDVWSYDLETAGWERLINDNEGWLRPRNAATLTTLRSGGASGTGSELLMQGGWAPFAETFNDGRILRVS